MSSYLRTSLTYSLAPPTIFLQTLYLESVVDQIFKHADLKKLASPSFYMSYIQFIQKSSSASSSDSSILETYKRATMIHPSSLDLWKNYLETIMAKEEETIKEGGVATFDAVFESALHALDQSSEECRFSVWSIKADIVVRKFNNGLLDGDQVDEQFAVCLPSRHPLMVSLSS